MFFFVNFFKLANKMPGCCCFSVCMCYLFAVGVLLFLLMYGVIQPKLKHNFSELPISRSSLQVGRLITLQMEFSNKKAFETVSVYRSNTKFAYDFGKVILR